MSRFTKRKVFNNNHELYQEMAEERDVNKFRQFETPSFIYPTAKQMKELAFVRHIWKSGDRFFKLASRHYGDSELWWVIAWFNKIPTEQHAKKGQVILIPKPIGKVLTYLGNDTYGRL